MPILHNIRRLFTCAEPGGQDDLHAIDDAALVWTADLVDWVGPAAELPDRFRDEPRHDAEGALVIPGLIDAHTHLVFGGWRADEFTQRIQGVSYLDLARQGGGIARTMRQTRAASKEDLYRHGMAILREMARLGITTIEAKSGYGLSVEDECKTLRVYRDLNAAQPVRIVPTFLGAHVVPPEYRDDRAGYLALLLDVLLPLVAEEQLATFCDVFVEDTAFSPTEARILLAAAASHGLRAKLHVDQLHDGGGAALAAEVEAISADHLEYAAPDGIAAMAEAGVIAVSLPLATFYLRQQAMPARAFIDAGVPVAVATDFNPGTAPSYHLPWAMTMACVMQRMTPAEVLKGATLYAAQAIGLADEIGSLEPGKRADFVLLDAPSVDHWLYHARPNAAQAVYIGGVMV